MVTRPATILFVVAMAAAAALGCTAQGTDRDLPPVEAGPATSAPDLAATVTAAINVVRNENGLSELSPDPDLASVAAEYSCQMADGGFFSHSDPAGHEVDDRMMAAGIPYLQVGENLAQNTNADDPAAVAVEGWMESPGHRDNILRAEFVTTGVGACRTGDTVYFTQLFVTPPE